MGPIERKALLDRWMSRSSPSEDDRMARAERMVRAAVDAHPAFDGYRSSIKVYPKGSYANQTNVRADSDVDIVVENQHLFYYEFFPSETQPINTGIAPYSGPWNSTSEWRFEVTKAMQNAFGSGSVDASGNVALTIEEVTGSRPSADVVPSFLLRRYDRPDKSITHVGSRVYTKDGSHIDNFPSQQKTNGIEKDRLTSGRYKKYVRALKSAENYLAATKKIDDLPSYFMECLVWNVPNSTITNGYALDEGFGATLSYLFTNLYDSNFDSDMWEEPNRLKWLFRGHSKWKPEDGFMLAYQTWVHMGYGS